MADQIANAIVYDANGRLVADPLLTVSSGGTSSPVVISSTTPLPNESAISGTVLGFSASVGFPSVLSTADSIALWGTQTGLSGPHSFQICAFTGLSGAGDFLPAINLGTVSDANTIYLAPNGPGQVNIGNGGLPNASAILQVDSTTQGMLPPRMTTTQRDAISAPAEGLEIYNLTTHKKNFWDGSAWRVVTSA